MKCNCRFENEYILPKGGYRVKEVKDDSGFYPIMTHIGKIVWVCKTCWKKLQELAQMIFDITKERWIYFPGLLKKED
jgi:hypothetical protein